MSVLLTACEPIKFIKYVATGKIEEEKPAEDDPEAPLADEKLQTVNDQNGYYYHTLNEAEKRIYLEEIYCILNSWTNVLSTTDETVIDNVFNCLMSDHPELFFLNGYSAIKQSNGEEIQKIQFGANYTYKKESWNSYQKKVDAAIKPCMNNISSLSSDYEKYKYIYDIIIHNTEYNLASNDNQSIISVFVNKESVCQGYAKAFQYICNKAGLECILVSGHLLQGESHAWNIVKADGDYYYVDVTLGDASYTYVKNGISYTLKDLKSINYDYLLLDETELSKTHKIETTNTTKCTSMEDNYYVKENLLLDDSSTERISEIISQGQAQDKNSVTIKCISDEVYNEVCNFLFTEKNIFELVGGDGKVEFVKNDNLDTITIFLKLESEQSGPS